MSTPESSQKWSEKGFYQLIEALPQLVLTLDLQDHIDWVNQLLL